MQEETRDKTSHIKMAKMGDKSETVVIPKFSAESGKTYRVCIPTNQFPKSLTFYDKVRPNKNLFKAPSDQNLCNKIEHCLGTHPKEFFVIVLFVYHANNDGELLPLQVHQGELYHWKISNIKWKKLGILNNRSTIINDGRQSQQVDLLLRLEGDPQWQNIEMDLAKDAAFKRDDASYVFATKGVPHALSMCQDKLGFHISDQELEEYYSFESPKNFGQVIVDKDFTPHGSEDKDPLDGILDI
jgi:hypothetical protein